MQLSIDSLRGEESKHLGQMQARNAMPAWMLDALQEKAKQLSNKRGFVCSDDVRLWAEKVGYVGISPNFWGGLFKGKGWQVIGYTKSTIASNHARRIAVYVWRG